MISKLDFEKAYEKMEWIFIEETLEDAGLPHNISLPMKCIKSDSCRLLWNGEITNEIRRTRGLGQGDPLLSYIFVLCLERLAQWIREKAENGAWKAVKASHMGPNISHLLFAYDIILFSEVDENQIMLIQEGLSRFIKASSQSANFSKSNVLFSPNVPEQVTGRLSLQLGIPFTKNMRKYLGFHLRHHGNNKSIQLDLLQKMRNKLAGWKS